VRAITEDIGCEDRLGQAAVFSSSEGTASKARIDWFALEGEHAEHAFVDAAQRLAADETLEPLDPQGELPNSQRPFRRKPA